MFSECAGAAGAGFRRGAAASSRWLGAQRGLASVVPRPVADAVVAAHQGANRSVLSRVARAVWGRSVRYGRSVPPHWLAPVTPAWVALEAPETAEEQRQRRLQLWAALARVQRLFLRFGCRPPATSIDRMLNHLMDVFVLFDAAAEAGAEPAGGGVPQSPAVRGLASAAAADRWRQLRNAASPLGDDVLLTAAQLVAGEKIFHEGIDATRFTAKMVFAGAERRDARAPTGDNPAAAASLFAVFDLPHLHPPAFRVAWVHR